jgi:hypothetical protein
MQRRRCGGRRTGSVGRGVRQGIDMKISAFVVAAIAVTLGWTAPIASAAAKADAPSESKSLVPPDPSAQQVVSLTPQAADALRRKVLAQCGLPEGPTNQLPWYFHFEFGRALLGSGDASRAVTELTQAVELNPLPHAAKRMYGMWYVDYFPYYQLAMAHAQLGNWTCAANAMRLSQMTEAASSEYFDMVKYGMLQRQIEGKAPYTESCKKDDVVR